MLPALLSQKGCVKSFIFHNKKANNMKIEIGQTVNYKAKGKTNYMKGGKVTGIHGDRAFVTWPTHGNSSISLANLEIA